MECGKKLRELREQRGETQEKTAKCIGISKSALNMYERGERVPRDEIKVKIAAYFESTVQDIFFAKCEH